MGISRLAGILTLMIAFLAVADFGGADDEVRHFDAESAINSASDPEFMFIENIKLKTNSNFYTLTDVRSGDFSTVKHDINFGLEVIIDEKFQLDSQFKKGSSDPPAYGIVNTPASSYVDLYSSSQMFDPPFTSNGLTISGSGSVAPGNQFKTSSDIIALRDAIDSRLSQIKSFESGFF